MGRFVSNQGTAAQLLAQCRVLIQEHTAVGIERCPSVLHSPELETGKDYQIILGKRIRNGGIIFQPC